MGIFDRKPKIIEAQVAPQIMGDQLNSIYNYIIPTVSRKDAMTVPALKRCRDLIAGTIAAIPLEYYKKSTGEMIGAPR
jgi:phage portal protein BeeE